MKIQIDVRNFSTPISGISRYIYEFLDNLNYDDHSVVLALPKKINNDFQKFLSFKNISVYTSEFFKPIYLYKNFNENILWCPAHRIPNNLPSYVKCVVTVHDLVWLRVKSTMQLKTFLGELFFFKKAIIRANKIICVSESTKSDLMHFFPFSSNKITVVHNGCSQKSIPYHKKSFKYFLFVGSFEPRKNIDNMLKAYANLDKEILNTYKFVIIGSNMWGNNDILLLCQKLNICNNVIIKQNISDNELYSYYFNAYCLVLTSIYEGFGYPIIEALQFNKPIITSNNSSMIEISGNSAIHVNPLSIQEITSAMEKIVKDKHYYNNLSLNASKLKYKFQIQECISKTISVFTQSIK